MGKLWSYLRTNPLSFLLIVLPFAFIAHFAGWPDVLVFLLSALGVIPMAGYIGEATEALSVHTGPKIGGLLNATLGNAAELIITLVAIQAGLLELVKASITGSILGNLLLVMGTSMLVGGARHGIQRFDRRSTGNHSTLLAIAVLALVIPTFFSRSIGPDGSAPVEELSLGVAGIMIALYAAGIFYTLRNQPVKEEAPLSYAVPEAEPGQTWPVGKAVAVLVFATIGVVVLSELLVGAVEGVVAGIGLSEFFLGIILIPIVGNVAEHLVAVQVASRNQMELSVGIAISSSLQVALFVAPLLVFLSLVMGHPLTLIFNPFELAALGSGVLVATMVAMDGESNWLEGTALLAIYLILGVAFFLL